MTVDGEVQVIEVPTNDGSDLKSYLRQLGMTLPPSNYIAKLITWIILVTLLWSVLWAVIGKDAIPGGNIFGIFTVFVVATVLGVVVKCIPKFSLPPLLGMLLAGLLLRNVPGIDFASHIDKKWSSSLRRVALVVILIRSGLGLNTHVLKKLKCTIIRLAFLPCITEAVVTGVMAHFLLNMRWQWAFQLGFVDAAVSLAVVIPSLLDLQYKYYGVDKGIPTLVMASASFDNVLCISAFGICLGLSFHSGNLVFNVFRGPIELAIGIGFGVFCGVTCWWFPGRKEEHVSTMRFAILIGCAMLSIFGSKAANFAGAGALGVLTMATVAAFGWGEHGKKPIAEIMAFFWTFFEPLLFGLVGAEVSIKYMNGSLVGIGLCILIVSLISRLVVTYMVLAGNNLTIKEKVFIAVSWLPKATVQAAIGSVSLDTARSEGFEGGYQEDYGIQILTIAVLSILVTSPVGAIGIMFAGPKMLTQNLPPSHELDKIANKDGINQTANLVITESNF